MLEQWDGAEPKTTPGPSTLRPSDRVSVYRTELKQWFDGTFTSSRLEPADDGGTQRASRIAYDAVGLWANCNDKQLAYYHCLDDEQWVRL